MKKNVYVYCVVCKLQSKVWKTRFVLKHKEMAKIETLSLVLMKAAAFMIKLSMSAANQ